MAMSRRPRVEVQAAVLFNDRDSAGRWIPLRVEIGSWVTLQPSTSGPWSRDARRYGQDSNAGAWKAQIVKFQWTSKNVRGHMVMHLDSVLVRHAYQQRQLLLDPEVACTEPRACNYLYASYWEDWVPPTSILDIILVLHHEVGEASRNGRSYKALMEDGTFYLRVIYVPRSGGELYGSLEALPLPELTDPQWPLPDMHSSEAFRRKLAVDIAAAMKGGTGSSAAHVQLFIPVHVMADLFACADSIRRTTTMYIFNSPSAKLLASLMDSGWDEKYEAGQDVIKCVVSHASIGFRYHIGRQTLYINFQYVCYRAAEGQTWIAIDQAGIVEMMLVTVMYAGQELPMIEVGRSWPVSHLRDEISILLPRNTVPEEYDLVIERLGHRDCKINGRRERTMEIAEALVDGGRFRMVPA